VDVDDEGRAWLAWPDGVAGKSALLAARETEQGWSVSSPTVGMNGSHSEVRIAVARDGAGVLAWEHQVTAPGIEVRALRASTWAVPAKGGTFSFEPYGYQHEVITARDGELMVVWNQVQHNQRRGVAVARRASGASEFDRPSDSTDILSPCVLFSNNPEVARNERGDVVITWFESVGEKLRVFVSERWGRGGRFRRATKDDALSPPDGDVEHPEPAVAEDGRAAVIWRQDLPGGGMAVFLAERDASGAWHRPSIADTFSNRAENAINTRVQFTPSGDLYAVWEEKNGEDWAVMAAHRDAFGAWIASGKRPLRLSSPHGRAIDPVLRVGADGSVAALWRERIDGRWRVMARRTSSDPSRAPELDRWSDAEELSAMGGDVSPPALAFGRGGAPHGDRVVAAWAQDGKIFTASIE
jgi:hypothetical protein